MRKIEIRREGSFITVIIKKEEKEPVSFFAKEIRGSLVWPTISALGYVCVLVQKTGIDIHGKCPLFFIEEAVEESSKALFDKLVDYRKRFSCGIFFNDLKKENDDLKRLFYDHCRYQKVPNIQLTRAPLIENINLRMDLVRDWAKSLEVPKGTVLCDQLERMSPGDLPERPEERFNAVNALSFALASLEKDGSWNSDDLIDIDAVKRRHKEKANPRGWT
jgi:hypothetical protein